MKNANNKHEIESESDTGIMIIIIIDIISGQSDGVIVPANGHDFDNFNDKTNNLQFRKAQMINMNFKEICQFTIDK